MKRLLRSVGVLLGVSLIATGAWAAVAGEGHAEIASAATGAPTSVRFSVTVGGSLLIDDWTFNGSQSFRAFIIKASDPNVADAVAALTNGNDDPVVVTATALPSNDPFTINTTESAFFNVSTDFAGTNFDAFGVAVSNIALGYPGANDFAFHAVVLAWDSSATLLGVIPAGTAFGPGSPPVNLSVGFGSFYGTSHSLFNQQFATSDEDTEFMANAGNTSAFMNASGLLTDGLSTMPDLAGQTFNFAFGSSSFGVDESTVVRFDSSGVDFAGYTVDAIGFEILRLAAITVPFSGVEVFGLLSIYSAPATVTANTALPEGHSTCANGGQFIEFGLDDGAPGGNAGSGVLEAQERDGFTYVCYPLNGMDGYSALVAVTSDTTSCASGGQKIESGLDNGDNAGNARDNILQAGEVDNTVYVCNGAAGEAGAAGPTGSAGADGAAGTAGNAGAEGAAGTGGVSTTKVGCSAVSGTPYLALVILALVRRRRLSPVGASCK